MLDEFQRDVVQHNILVQQQRKKWHDKFIKKKQFQTGDWVLLYDSRFKNFKVKFHTCWMGPYEVIQVLDNGVVKVKTMDRWNLVFLVNGHRLKAYFQPLTKEDFMQQVQEQYELHLVGGYVSLLWFDFFSLEIKFKQNPKNNNIIIIKGKEKIFSSDCENNFY